MEAVCWQVLLQLSHQMFPPTSWRLKCSTINVECLPAVSFTVRNKPGSKVLLLLLLRFDCFVVFLALTGSRDHPTVWEEDVWVPPVRHRDVEEVVPVLQLGPASVGGRLQGEEHIQLVRWPGGKDSISADRLGHLWLWLGHLLVTCDTWDICDCDTYWWLVTLVTVTWTLTRDLWHSPRSWKVLLEYLPPVEDDHVKAGDVLRLVLGGVAVVTVAVVFQVRRPTATETKVTVPVEVVPIENSLLLDVWSVTAWHLTRAKAGGEDWLSFELEITERIPVNRFKFRCQCPHWELKLTFTNIKNCQKYREGDQKYQVYEISTSERCHHDSPRLGQPSGRVRLRQVKNNKPVHCAGTR